MPGWRIEGRLQTGLSREFEKLCAGRKRLLQNSVPEMRRDGSPYL